MYMRVARRQEEGGEELQGGDKVGGGGSQRIRKPDRKLEIFCVTKKNV